MGKMKRWAFVLGIFAGGMVIGQAFVFDADVLKRATPDQIVGTADELYLDYTQAVKQSKSAAQTTQVASEMLVRMEYLQIKQNGEMIRLLNDIKNKK